MSGIASTSNFIIDVKDNRTADILFNNNGTKVYAFSSKDNRAIREYTLGNAYTVGNLTSNLATEITQSIGNIQAACFGPSTTGTAGGAVYIFENTSKIINQYDLATPYTIVASDLTTATKSIQTNNSLLQDASNNVINYTNVNGLFVKSDGTSLMLTDNSVKRLIQISFGTANDVSSIASTQGGVITSNIDISVIVGGQPFALYVIDSGVFAGKLLYLIDRDTTKLVTFLLSTAYDLTTATHISANDITASSVNNNVRYAVSIFGPPDGSAFYIKNFKLSDGIKLVPDIPYSFVNNWSPYPIASACFLKDTIIKTDSGNVKIQDIKEEKHTINGKKVKALTKTLYAKKGDSIPPFLVSIPKDALFKNSPDKETFVSPLHSVFYNGELIFAKDLVLMDKASPVNYNYKDYVYDILLDSHEKMVANNMIVETLDPESITGRFYRHFVINKNASSEEKALAKTILYEFNNFYWNECLNYPKINPEMKYDFDEAVYKKFLKTCKTSEKKKIFKSLV
jgi:hypothetical protein